MTDNLDDVTPEHPGGFMRLFLMPARGLTPDTLASRSGLPSATVEGLIDGSEPVTHDVAIRLATVFGHAAETLYRMQAALDIYQTTGQIASHDQLPVLGLEQ